MSIDSTAPHHPLAPEVAAALSEADPRLGEALAAIVPALCRDHPDLIRSRLASAAALSHDAALDDLPGVLQAWAESYGNPAALPKLAGLGPAHAAARDGQGFTVVEIVREYLLLRRNVFSRLPGSLGRPLTEAEHEAIQSGLDGILTGTMGSVFRQREARLGLETAARGNYLASLAHEVGNQVAGAMVTLNVVDQMARNFRPRLAAADQAQLDELLHDIRNSRTAMDSASAAMARILDSERARQRVGVRFFEVDIPALLHGVSRSLERLDRKSGDPSRIQFAGPKGLWIKTDPDLVSTVMINLLGNALKHAPTGPITLTAAVAGNVCRMEVRDEGPGLPPESREHLFTKFGQGEGGREGFGIGLFIAQRAANLLGGTIDVSSEPGRGSCFTFALPIAPSPT